MKNAHYGKDIVRMWATPEEKISLKRAIETLQKEELMDIMFKLAARGDIKL